LATEREIFRVGQDQAVATGNLSPPLLAGVFYLVITVPSLWVFHHHAVGGLLGSAWRTIPGAFLFTCRRTSKPDRGVPTDEEKFAAALQKARKCLTAMSDIMRDRPWFVGQQLILATDNPATGCTRPLLAGTNLFVSILGYRVPYAAAKTHRSSR
jgi:hypothetical protein